MKKIKYLILALLIIIVCISGFFLGRKHCYEEYERYKNEIDEEIVIAAINESFGNINVLPKDGIVSEIRLVCQNGKRYLYAFRYKFFNEYSNLEEIDDFAIEMIIDKDTEFYYVESLEHYYNRFDNRCLNLYE